ncbi:hypothetical protein K8Q20_29455 [Klebsiella pneumoniae]
MTPIPITASNPENSALSPRVFSNATSAKDAPSSRSTLIVSRICTRLKGLPAGKVLCTDLPWQGINEDQNLGIAITRRALEAPLRAIVANAGEEPSVIVANVKAGEGSYGYNAATGEFGDMIAMGILDPTKVTRSALQHAASVAGLAITTEVVVAEVPKKEEPAMPGAGGMGGMGGMDF